MASAPEDSDEPKFGDFEANLKKLQGAVSRLESPELTLEEAFEELENGTAAYKSCRRILEFARSRYEILVKDVSGPAVRWASFEEADEDSDGDGEIGEN